MSGYEQKDLSGSIFKNNRKEKPTHPDLTGTALIEGKHYWVSAWEKIDKNGNPWFSFSFKEKDFSQAKQAVKSAPQDKFEDDLPPF